MRSISAFEFIRNTKDCSEMARHDHQRYVNAGYLMNEPYPFILFFLFVFNPNFYHSYLLVFFFFSFSPPLILSLSTFWLYFFVLSSFLPTLVLTHTTIIPPLTKMVVVLKLLRACAQRSRVATVKLEFPCFNKRFHGNSSPLDAMSLQFITRSYCRGS